MNHGPQPHFYSVVLKINMRVAEGIRLGEETSKGIRYFGKIPHYLNEWLPSSSSAQEPKHCAISMRKKMIQLISWLRSTSPEGTNIYQRFPISENYDFYVFSINPYLGISIDLARHIWISMNSIHGLTWTYSVGRTDEMEQKVGTVFSICKMQSEYFYL